MCILKRFGVVVALLLTLATAQAEETKLFNGKDLDGWTFHPQSDDQPEVEQPWIAQQGMLINRGVASGFLIHKDDFENYVLALEVRTMSTEEGNGLAIGSLGSVFINAAPEKAEVALMPRAIEISISEPGDVYFRDIDVDTFFHHKDKNEEESQKAGEPNKGPSQEGVQEKKRHGFFHRIFHGDQKDEKDKQDQKDQSGDDQGEGEGASD